MDPRVKVAPLALSQQRALELMIIEAMGLSHSVVQEVNDLRRQLQDLQKKLNSDPGAKSLLDVVNSLDKKAAALVAVEQQYPPVGVVSAASLNGALGSLLVQVEGADTAPTHQAIGAFGSYSGLLNQQLSKWEALNGKDLPALNALLQQRQLPPVVVK